MNHLKQLELLAPAGNFEKLQMALHYGADAVYLGMSDFSLRARAQNFDLEELKRSIDFVHSHGKKAYITINIFTKNSDVKQIEEHVLELKRIGPDAIILSDPGVFDIVATEAPEIDIHISTQANVGNYSAARFWERMGAKRIILARELSFNEIREIRDKVSLDLECFIHGSLCMAYSGRCYISSFISNRSGNEGECANSCRYNYTLMGEAKVLAGSEKLPVSNDEGEFDYFVKEDNRPDDYFPIYEDDRGTYLMSSHDLCMVEYIQELADTGINSLKIEGRMKGVNYVGGVVKVYREALDCFLDGRSADASQKQKWKEELQQLSSRGFTTGLYLGSQPDEGYNHDQPRYFPQTHDFVGILGDIEGDEAVLHLRNNLKPGDDLTFITSGPGNINLTVNFVRNANGEDLDIARNGDSVRISVPAGVRENDIVRRKLNVSTRQPT
ncbi:MAG: U32 family peptidase [Spirochaetia bacterium]|nr:U32 family peptidase [Spirochaetia bacterium]